MATTDLFLRSRAKVQSTDLWLHPAGPSGSTPPPILASGTAEVLLSLASVESLADSGSESLTLLLSGIEVISEDQALEALTLTAEGIEGIADVGDALIVISVDEQVVGEELPHVDADVALTLASLTEVTLTLSSYNVTLTHQAANAVVLVLTGTGTIGLSTVNGLDLDTESANDLELSLA